MATAETIIRLRIDRRDVAAEGIIRLDLVSADGGVLPPFEAGAHVDIHIAPGLVRQYSLTNDPRQRDRYVLGILRDPASRGGSAAIHETFRVGDEISAGLPRNQFRLVENAARTILLAGGIGVTPMLAMAQRLNALAAPFELHYCARSRSRAAFLDLIAESPFAERVTTHFDDEAAEQRFDAAAVLMPDPSAHLYVCGPTGFMDHVLTTARSLGWAEDRLHVEYFSAAPEMTGAGFTVRAARSGGEFAIPEDASIAQVLLRAGIAIPLSCEQGICGACLTPVLEGRPDHRDMFQTDEEKAANTQITVCCSRALSSLLVLDL